MKRRVSRIWQESRRCENYLLAGRAIRTAWRVWRALPERRVNPHLGPAIRAATILGNTCTAKGWRISDPGKIVWLADLLTRLPVRWGRCVQQSLITCRLLNDYGIPSSICYGVPLDDPAGEGHAWVRVWQEKDQTALPLEPLDRFRVVFTLPHPADNQTMPTTPDAHDLEDRSIGEFGLTSGSPVLERINHEGSLDLSPSGDQPLRHQPARSRLSADR